MKRSQSLAVAIVVVALAFIAGCSSTQPKYSEVSMSSQMTPSEFNPQVLSYQNPNVDVSQYRKVILEKAEIYNGPDAEWKDVSQEEQQELVTYLYDEASKVLQEKGLLTDQPGPGVAVLKLTLAGAEKTRPVASTATHVLPIGLALNLGKGALGKNGSFMGTATVGGEFTDSANGTLIVSFLAKEAPNAMDIPKIVSTWGASKKAIDKVAEQIGERLQQIQLSQK